MCRHIFEQLALKLNLKTADSTNPPGRLSPRNTWEKEKDYQIFEKTRYTIIYDHGIQCSWQSRH